MVVTQENLWTSKHFHLMQVTDGIYVALALDGTGAGSNAGIIDLGGTTLVFDTFYTVQAAQDLHLAAESLLKQPISVVINSHWHADHVLGNQVFAPYTPIVATTRTRELMATTLASTLEQGKTELPSDVQALEEQLTHEEDEQKRRALTIQQRTFQELMISTQTLELTLPTQTFDHQRVFSGSRRRVELSTFGAGHTESDALLYLPQEQIVFAGDLLSVSTHPWLGHGNPQAWLRILEHIEALDTSLLVPGHGPIGTKQDCVLLSQYIHDLERVVAEQMKKGATAEQISQTSVPTLYTTWKSSEVFLWNVQFLYGSLNIVHEEK